MAHAGATVAASRGQVANATSAAAISDALLAESPPPEPPAPVAPAVPEWHVGIDGAPAALTTEGLREKIREGKVTGESLVWKATFENWKPLASVPELLAMLEAARSAAPRAAVVALVTPRATAAPAPPVVTPTEPAPDPGVSREPFTPVEVASTSHVVSAAELPHADDAVSKSSRRLAVVMDDDEGPVSSFKLPKRAATPLAAWFAIVIAMAFGIVIGAVVFGSRQPKEVIRYVEVPVPKVDKAAPPEEAKPAEVREVAAAEDPAAAQPGQKGARRPASPAPAATGKPGSLLAGLSAAPQTGPGPAGGTENAPAQQQAGGGQLDATSIQRTVSTYVPAVRRGCWQPALDARSPDAPSSARVVATITVAPSGAVDNVTSTGDPAGYPGLARCIESRVRGWKFPAGSGTTTANVPFVFAAQ